MAVSRVLVTTGTVALKVPRITKPYLIYFDERMRVRENLVVWWWSFAVEIHRLISKSKSTSNHRDCCMHSCLNWMVSEWMGQYLKALKNITRHANEEEEKKKWQVMQRHWFKKQNTRINACWLKIACRDLDRYFIYLHRGGVAAPLRRGAGKVQERPHGCHIKYRQTQ